MHRSSSMISTKSIIQRNVNRLLRGINTSITPSFQSIQKSTQWRNITSNKNYNTTSPKEFEFKERHMELKSESKNITLSLYRTCQRCVQIIRPGNKYDEKEFQKREQENKSNPKGIRGPAVNRDNELSSRANYYYDFMKENFIQEMDCLDAYPLLEMHIQKYLYLIRIGEERRQWLMKEYKFQDPFVDSFDFDRLKRWENCVMDLVRDVYKDRGWVLEQDLVQPINVNTISVDPRHDDDDDLSDIMK